MRRQKSAAQRGTFTERPVWIDILAAVTHNRQRAAAVLSGWIVLSLWAGGVGGMTSTQAPAHDVFDRCDREESVDTSTWGADTVRMVASFERDGAAWIARDAADLPRRTISAALCALDTGAAIVGTTQQVHARRLFAWARQVMTTQDADPRAASWHRASVAVVQYVGYWDIADAHIIDARRVLGATDPDLQLADAIAIELRDWRRSGVQIDVPSRPGATLTTATPDGDASAEAARAAFERLRAVTDIADEATIRLGVTLARLGDHANALALVDTFVTRDPASPWATIAHLVGAVSASRLEEADAAWRHIEAARARHPRAQSVVTLWVALAATRGLDAEATAMVEAYSAAPDDDPWMTYRQGHGARWVAHRDAVRQAVRR